MIVVASWTAMCQGEIRKLRWEWIDFNKKLINLPAAVTKT
jgi:integrase